ncbi:ATP-binding protein [Rhodanobacter sp. C01]|uniref:sensor histidine kinase n=1 Tax=Rhodanobacter sp. C01 TaxID=1945856 RepID=UPI0009876685|nr:ATP-binding protein [Rhodanobacter sp. C01]OOG49574.1 hypothetical protein B0E50_05540 [Rhodanobacter sp. C01]
MFERLLGWSGRIPINDPVDRRNAVFMQWLFVFEGFRTPLNKIYMLLFDWSYLQSTYYDQAKLSPGMAVVIDLGTDVAMTIAAWLGLYLIRLGRFHLAVGEYLAVLLGSGIIAYAAFGFSLGASSDQILIVVLALAALMLGRKALWMSYMMIMLTFIVGMTSNYIFSRAMYVTAGPYGELPSLALDYVQIVVILDLSVTSLRKGLAESNAHRRQLQHEMTERERAQEQLLHAQKMDAVGRLASGIAHDLNNVLEIILGFTTERDRIDDSVTERNKDALMKDALVLADALDGIELAARRGSSICRKLLSFSRSDVTHVESFDATDALRELQPLLRQSLPPTVRLSIDVPDMPLVINFDRSQFELALLNLAANARDAMPNGGECSIAVAQKDSSTMVLSIHDTGVGMSKDVRMRIFEPFFTTKPSGSGTGLGLAIVYSLIDRAGGHIEVSSAFGAGTTFHIYLPVAIAKAVDALPA